MFAESSQNVESSLGFLEFRQKLFIDIFTLSRSLNERDGFNPLGECEVTHLRCLLLDCGPWGSSNGCNFAEWLRVLSFNTSFVLDINLGATTNQFVQINVAVVVEECGQLIIEPAREKLHQVITMLAHAERAGGRILGEGSGAGVPQEGQSGLLGASAGRALEVSIVAAVGEGDIMPTDVQEIIE